MTSEIINGVFSIFAFEPIVAIILGTILGLVVGAIPGLAGIMAIAIVLPMTFYLSPIVAIPMLLGVYRAGIYGGSISAILINTPGAPSSVCTTFDGYPLAKQGKGGKALNMALAASIFGDVFGTIVLIFIAAPVSLVALKAGPAERTTLILFALTVVGLVSGKSFIKGLISCAFGLWISCLGVSEATGAIRFSFGIPQLSQGVTFIPLLIGLLVLSEVITKIDSKEKIEHIDLKKSANPDDNRLKWKEFWGCKGTLLKSSIIGAIIGALPGMGGVIASFVGYGEAKRSSKHPEKFGTGVLEGIAAPEAANNAVCSAAMIPVLTLSIPGDDVTAILMGAFMIQGITPGPQIFFEHTRTIYAIYGGLFICDIALYFVAKTGFPFWIRCANAPRYLVFSLVTVFCFIGAYSINQSFFDIIMLVVFCVIGHYMKRFEFSPAALIIGFILGPLIEDSMNQALTLSDGSFMIFITRPIAAFFVLLTVISVVTISYAMKKQKNLMRVN